MNLNRLAGATALATTLFLSPVAWAQTAPSNGAAGDITTPGQTEADAAGNKTAGQIGDSASSDTAGTDVVVTGSRIARPNDDSPAPISTVSAAELGVTAKTSVGDVLNDLPQLRSSFSQSNSTRFLGTAGLNLLDLRGLGTQRTLVLVNGRRHVGSDVLNNAVSVDTNTIPTDLIERVDIVTGASSAVYGSDALAGVVNFVLKDHFDGIQLRGQGGVSQYGDAGSYSASALIGKNFSEGRGNIAINGEYARQNSLYASQRKYARSNDTFVTVDSDAAGLTGNSSLNSDGNPDAVFFRDVRSATINANGLIAFASPTGACGRDTQPNAMFGGAGRPFTCNYIFNSAGQLIQETGTRVGLGTTATSGGVTRASATPTGSFIGGNGDTRREGQLVQIQPQLDRYSANLIGHYEFSPAFVPFIEAKYSRTDSVGQGTSGPAFYTGSTIDALYERPRLDNPYLDATARATIASQILASGINPNNSAALTAANRAAIADGSFRFILRKNLVDLGVRTEEARRETYRAVAGVRGEFNNDWHYELSGNYGEFRESTKVLGNINVQRLSLGLDAVRNASGQIVCGSQIDATRANGDGTDLAGNAAILATDIAACVPINPFGTGNMNTDAVRNYVLQDTVSKGKITQLDINGFMSGDLSQLLTLPGGDVAFSVGGEYRRETIYYRQDPLVEAGYTFYNSIPVLDPTSFEVKEAYGELQIPLLKNFVVAKELTLSAAGRISDYKGSAGTTYTYNLSATYAPIDGIRFRANYGRGVRAPNLSELYSPQGQNFGTVSDPCSARNLGNGTQYRAANCAAAGIPTSYDYVYASSLELVSGGNPDLDVEKSDSYTYGVVLQPKFIPGLTLSADYYNIKVNNVITAPSAQQIINSCYDTPTGGNQFCSLFTRVPAGETGPNGEEAYRIVEGSLQQTLLNYAKLQVRGLDVDLAYTKRFSGDAQFTSHLIYSHQFQNDQFLDPTQPGFADTLLGEVGQPRDEVSWTLSGSVSQIFADLQLRYLAKQSVGAIENHISFQGRDPQNLDDYDIPFYPDVFYANLRFGVNVNDQSNFYFGIDNLTNRLPPLGATGTGAGSAIFETIGRRFYAGVQARF